MRLRIPTLVLLQTLWLTACGSSPPVLPPGDSGVPEAGQDAGEPIQAEASRWTWIPVEGSQCASGSTTGMAVNPSPDGGEDLFVFLQGGGACWNQGTCVPSLLQYGPLCEYGTFCLADVAGGVQPTAVHVTHRDPYPADGGGPNLQADLKQLTGVRVFDRADVQNPFRAATFVYVPYCTGDLHAGTSTRTYQYKYGLFDQPSAYTVHFNGANNVDLFLQRLKATYPAAKRIWLTGSSAGGYGATFNLPRFRRAFPSAEVHLLADSSPFLQPIHWAKWVETWNLSLPEGCTDCDAGMPAVMKHLSQQYPDSRLGLLAYETDPTIAWFFFAPPGLQNILTPPLAPYTSGLQSLETAYDATANSRYFVVPARSHVAWGSYGNVLPDGGTSLPVASRDGGTDLKAFIDGWATGGADFRSTR